MLFYTSVLLDLKTKLVSPCRLLQTRDITGWEMDPEGKHSVLSISDPEGMAPPVLASERQYSKVHNVSHEVLLAVGSSEECCHHLCPLPPCFL